MAVEHRITSTDTIRTLAQQYLGDSTRWTEIAEFNGLSYPYIVEDDDARRNLTHGNGYIRVDRTNYRTARTLARGWQLYTELDAFSGQQKVFEVTADIPFAVEQQTAYVPIRATIKGVYGNIPNATNLYAGRGFTENGFSIDLALTIDSLSGGQDVRVLIVGEYIYVPDNQQSDTYTDWARMVAFVGEEDIALNEEGELYVDGFGDIASVTGVDNISQALNHRLMTERGTLKLHPTYGSGLHALIGKAQNPYLIKMVELDIYETLSYEDRIRDVTITNTRIEGATVHVALTFRLQEVERVIERELALNY